MATPDAKAASPDTPPANPVPPKPDPHHQDPPGGAAATAHRKPPWRWIVGAVVIGGLLIVGVPRLIKSLGTVSTDDAFVNGHVTFVAARVPGQVARVLVEDNNRVRRGDLLIQLDREPLQVQVNIAQSTVAAAQADLAATIAQTRGMEGLTRSLRFSLEHAIEDVNSQVALLRSKVAILQAQKAILDKAQTDFGRATTLVEKNALSPEEFDQRKQSLLVAQARVAEAQEDVFQVRAGLGLPPKPEKSDDLTQVPPDLDQTSSSVQQAQAKLIQAAAELGVNAGFDKTPRQMVADFYKRDPQGDITKIYEQLLKEAPGVKQAEAKLASAQAALEQAKLNLRYCDVVAEIDGVVTRREVNPGNNVVAGQSLMAIRSLTDIWIDANFKETQLAPMRIGQSVDIDVDMYGSRQSFKGRISGFTMGTGSTLALLPAENATGNFVKVVQRLPVRIDLVDYDPEKQPLFIGLSVTPTVLLNEPAAGPDAGKVLQPYSTVTAPPAAKPASPEVRP
jgi:membrane fusion protein (multidrug efflux system)